MCLCVCEFVSMDICARVCKPLIFLNARQKKVNIFQTRFGSCSIQKYRRSVQQKLSRPLKKKLIFFLSAHNDHMVNVHIRRDLLDGSLQIMLAIIVSSVRSFSTKLQRFIRRFKLGELRGHMLGGTVFIKIVEQIYLCYICKQQSPSETARLSYDRKFDLLNANGSTEPKMA